MAKTKSTDEKQCSCLTEVQEKLKPHGVQLKTELLVNFKTGAMRNFGPFLAITRISKPDKGFKKVTSLSCCFCPFCGKKAES